MARCIFYGTIMDKQYNNKRIRSLFGEESLKLIDSIVVPGFELFDTRLGYPAAVKSNEKDKMKVEVYEVSERALEYIKAMEEGSGYHVDIVPVGPDYCKIFIQKGPRANYIRINDGDWVGYHESQKKQGSNESNY